MDVTTGSSGTVSPRPPAVDDAELAPARQPQPGHGRWARFRQILAAPFTRDRAGGSWGAGASGDDGDDTVVREDSSADWGVVPTVGRGNVATRLTALVPAAAAFDGAAAADDGAPSAAERGGQ